jgi:hypothetical protein
VIDACVSSSRRYVEPWWGELVAAVEALVRPLVRATVTVADASCALRRSMLALAVLPPARRASEPATRAGVSIARG